MKQIRLLFALVMVMAACHSAVDKGETVPDTMGAKAPLPIGAFLRKEKLQVEEIAFLKELARQNEAIIWGDRVERFYDSAGKVVSSRLVFNEDSLREKGYVYYSFTASGMINDGKISYAFSEGQAMQGYGGVAGENGREWLHTIHRCGVTACIDQVYNNNGKLFEKETSATK